MPKRYLVLDKDSGLIAAVDDKPTEPYVKAMQDQKVFGRLVDVWCTSDTSDKSFADAANVFSLRLERADLFKDVQGAAQQLQDMFKKDGTGYIALGGSPKLVKWLLKKRGFNVVTVNASEVKYEAEPTNEFEAYLNRKLLKLGEPGPGRLVVMDFADTGASLARIKADLKKLRPKADVQAVAVGKSPKFDKESNAELRAQVDKVLVGIDTLQSGLYKQTIKVYFLGRNKVKNPYKTWSEERSAKLEKATVPRVGGHDHFQRQKSVIPKMMELPTIKVDVDDFLDAEPQGGDSDWEA